MFVMVKFELCANSCQSLLNGIAGGADCAELCEAIELGGLTPSYGTLVLCADSAMHFPVRVLIRCRPGNYIYSDDEIYIMCEDIKRARFWGYEGVVIGALTADGRIDIPAIKRMMAAGEGMKFTFNRAIDACENQHDALITLINLGFDKVLTSGCQPTAYKGISMIESMHNLFGDQINIMAGGGINSNNVLKILKQTGVAHCHASLTSQVTGYQDDLYPNGIDSTGSSMRYKVSDLSKIRKFVKIIKQYTHFE